MWLVSVLIEGYWYAAAGGEDEDAMKAIANSWRRDGRPADLRWLDEEELPQRPGQKIGPVGRRIVNSLLTWPGQTASDDEGVHSPTTPVIFVVYKPGSVPGDDTIIGDVADRVLLRLLIQRGIDRRKKAARRAEVSAPTGGVIEPTEV